MPPSRGSQNCTCRPSASSHSADIVATAARIIGDANESWNAPQLGEYMPMLIDLVEHVIEEDGYRAQPSSALTDRLTESSSYYSSAAVCANAGHASIDKNGNRPRGTHDRVGRSIPTFQPHTSPAWLLHRQKMFSGDRPSMT
jgi:hypothetical protein